MDQPLVIKNRGNQGQMPSSHTHNKTKKSQGQAGLGYNFFMGKRGLLAAV
jgi:hypothetical protein